MDPNGSLQSPSTTIVVPPQELHRAQSVSSVMQSDDKMWTLVPTSTHMPSP